MSLNLLHIFGRRFFLLLCILFFGISAKSQGSIDFSADITRGCAPLVVKFADLSSHDSSETWFWDFGNGNTSTQENPGTIYFTPGNYDVKLVVKTANGIDSLIKKEFIILDNKPDISFLPSDTIGCIPLSVKFTDVSDTTSGTIASWQWDFGDGNSSTRSSPSHTYIREGDFTVTLKAISSRGCISVLTRANLIHVKQTPKADFVSHVSSTCTRPVNVKFSNNSSGGQIVNVLWSFGDGNISTQLNPSHTFMANGTYNIKLIITNNLGCVDSITKPTVIGLVTPAFTGPDAICQGATANFANLSVPFIASSSWTFGDGTYSSEKDPQKIYNTFGTFEVKLVNDFGGCKDSITKNIIVLPKPTADFSYTAPPASCSVPVTISFNNSSSNAFSYFWDLGDGSSTTEVNPTHIYTTHGSFHVKLTVTGANGCPDTSSKQSIISILPTVINKFNNLPFSGCTSSSITFSADISSPEPISSYLWTFGDGSTSTLANPVHAYTNNGTYDVSLQITTANGCMDTLLLPAAVVISAKPVANFAATPRLACSREAINFVDGSTGGVNNWLWQFGDSSFSKIPDPIHLYTDTGSFSVTLIVGNSGCFDTLAIPDYIYINPPVADFHVVSSCSSPYIKKFDNKSVGALTNTWDFGDGSTSTSLSPVHTYSSPGTYIVVLNISNNSCTDTLKDTIQVIDVTPEIATSSNMICKMASTVFTAKNANPLDISTYTWNFDDGTGDIKSTAPDISHTYIASGSYNASLTILDKLGCRRKVPQPLSLTVYGPTADFSNDVGNCISKQINFTDLSKQYPGYPITSWVLNYGDGSLDSSNTTAFSHTYASVGVYDVLFAITDISGCKDTVLKRKAVTITDPKALFVLSDSLSCSHSKIDFIDSSTGLDLTAVWSFGDNTGSTQKNPSHNYNVEGVYTVSLTVTDTFGCKNTYSKPEVVIKDPRAIFSLSDSIASCPPARISFNSSSLNTMAIQWDFDDGGFASIDTPSHFFLTAKTYSVKLTAYGYGTCVDSAVRKVVVKGPSGSFTYNPILKCSPAAIIFEGTAINNDNNFIWDFGDGTTISTSSFSVSHIYTTPGKYVPKVLLQDIASTCKVSVFGTDTITAFGIKTYIKTVGDVFCDSSKLHFSDSSVIQYDKVASYLWTFGDGATSDIQNPFHNYVNAGIYPVKLIVKTAGDCTDTSKTSVKIVKSPQLQLTGPIKTCVDQPVTYTGSLQQDTSAVTWSWDFGNGNTYNTQSPPAQSYSIAGNYAVNALVTNSSGCIDTVSKILTVDPLPDVNAGTDSIICLGQKLTLVPSGAVSYVWQSDPSLSCTNCADPIASPVDTSVYYLVTGTSAASCKKTDSIQVKVVHPFSISNIAFDTICAGKSATLWVKGADNYTWSPSAGLNDVNSADPIASPTASIVYTVIGHDYKNCFSDTAYIPITIFPIPVFNIIADKITISAGKSVTLTTTGSPDIVSYEWFPATGLSCSNCKEPVASPANNIVYKAIAANKGGCTAEDDVTIQVFCNNADIFIPNTFSPNNDGNNDVFFPKGKGVAGIKRLQIFNRWGSIVFQKTNFSINDPRSGWDGTLQGRQLDTGVFVYEMEVVCDTGQVFSFKGDITLIR